VTVPNRLREFREGLGLTQERAAGALGIDVGTISRHELGKCRPRGFARQGYTRLYGTSEDVLWPVGGIRPPGTAGDVVLSAPWTAGGTVEAALAVGATGGGHVERRSFLVLSGAVLTAPAHRWLAEEPGPLQAAMGGDRVTPALADRLPAMIAELRRMDDAHGGAHVLDLAEREFDWVTKLLDNGSYDAATGRALHRSLADLGQLAGWLAWDVGQPALAQRYGIAGLRAAHSADDHALGAHVVQSMAMQTEYDGKPAEALEMFETVFSQTRHLPSSVVAIAYGHATYAYALLGDLRACENAHGVSLEAWDKARDSADLPTWLYWLSERNLYEMGGESFLTLGRPERAIGLMHRATLVGTSYTRDAADHLIWLSRAQLGQGEADGACESAHAALDLVEEISSPRLLDRMRMLCEQMHPYSGNAGIREFLERADDRMRPGPADPRAG